ncbi:DUF2314 domain-containing protein [uncultured Shimia sp.]|uniref:DUF2314 domain-containing protein n=1 Tax=uncultured Shimia sp. TaxID=573152 RepID=UPI0026126537|nr:DUF2314 domain-containing protein [uncultured Shimia sp.]
MSFKFPIKRVAFWGGLALAVWVGQQTGIIGSGANTQVSGTNAQNNVMQVHEADEAMLKAQADAKQGLPTFLKAAETPPADWENVSIKVAMQGENQIENIWVMGFQNIEGTQYSGVLGNDPIDMPGLKAGDRVTFDYDQINDWAYIENGTGYGFYSVRAMLPMMDQDQAAGVMAFLSKDPMPTSW